MNKILLVLLLLPVLVFGQATDLFFSEYIEGTSYNKAIEIYNGTGSEVELSNYIMRGSSNEATGWEHLYTFPEGATVANGDVYVISHSSADAAVVAQGDWVTSGYVVGYNGNDSRGLFKVEGTDTTLIDLLGDPNNPDQLMYSVAGVSNGMAEHTIVRKSSVTQGNTDWAASAGTNADDSEWIVFDQNEFSYLGFHTMGGDASPIISNVTFEVFNPGSIDLNATVVDDGSITDVSLTYYFIEDDVAGMPVTVAMDAAGDDVYSVTVDASTLSDGDGFVYYIEATDDATPTANVTTSNDYKVLMGVTPLIKLHNVLLGKTLMYDGFLVKSTGIANVEAGLFSQSYYSFYMQDATGGINLYKNESVTTIYNLGDELTVTGIVDEYNNLTELIFETIVVNSTGNSVDPVEMTSASLTEEYEGMLVKLFDVSPAGTITWANYTNFTMQDDDGEFIMHIWNANFEETTEPDWPADITGIVSQHIDNYQIIPRYTTDISTLVGIEDDFNIVTSKFSVEQNYPNPFNPTTEISYTVPKAGNVEFKVFNVLGQEVFAAKINAVAGANSYRFNGVNLSSGLYFYQVQQGVNTVTKKMVLMK